MAEGEQITESEAMNYEIIMHNYIILTVEKPLIKANFPKVFEFLRSKKGATNVVHLNRCSVQFSHKLSPENMRDRFPSLFDSTDKVCAFEVLSVVHQLTGVAALRVATFSEGTGSNDE